MNDGEAGSTQVPPQAPARAALVLFDLGSPANAADVKPFLRRAYGDPHVMHLPFGTELQKLFAAVVATWRAPKLAAALRESAAAFPERQDLEALAQAVCARLGAAGLAFTPYLAFRHGSPGIAETLARAEADGFKRIVALHARPFSGPATSGSALGELRLATADRDDLDLSVIDHFDDDAAVRASWAAVVRDALQALPEDQREGAHLLFALQGLPLGSTRDPALPSALAFAEAVRSAAGVSNTFSVAYQTGVDPRAPLLPAIEDELEALARAGRRAVVAIPVAHCCESLASRWELDVAIKKLAAARGIAHFVRAPSPSGRADFAAALEAVVRRHVEEMQALRS